MQLLLQVQFCASYHMLHTILGGADKEALVVAARSRSLAGFTGCHIERTLHRTPGCRAPSSGPYGRLDGTDDVWLANISHPQYNLLR